MRIGLLSDSHDHAAHLRGGIERLVAAGAQVLLHMGDLCGVDMLDHFAGLPEQGIPVHFVFGNNDYDKKALRARASHHHLVCHGHVGRLTLAGRALAFTHGDNSELMAELARSGTLDYVFYGHTHRAADTRVGKTRLINPGALSRANPKTVALLDLATGVRESFTLGV